jgi:signal transduction histidine kinase/ActR/RegA family two-component response regulator
MALGAPAPAFAQGDTRGVLILNSYNLGYTWSDELTRGVRVGLEASSLPIELSVEFLDARRRGEERYPQMRALLNERYTQANTRLIIAGDDPALEFLVDRAPDLLPSVPVVFCGISDGALVARLPRARFTGVRQVLTLAPYLDLGISLHAARRIFVVSDGTLTSRLHRQAVEAYGRQGGPPMTHLDGHDLSLDEIVAALRRDTTPRDLVFTTSFTLDHTGQSYNVREGLARIAAASAAPSYSAMSSEVGQGLLVSGVNEGFQHGLATARLALAVLRGRSPAHVPIETATWVGYQFDYQQLARFGVDESRLPAAAIVVGRPRSFYRENRPLIWTVTLLILGQSGVIATLTWNVLRRRRAERELARTEADLRHAQKMDAIGRLAGGIAHDFNNLLTVINGHAVILRETLGEVIDRDAAASVEEIEKAGNQAAGLTRQLLAFSRKQLLQARVVNLNQIVGDLESMLGRLIGERIALTTALDPDLRNLTVDPGQIQQVIVNLVVNARDAMPEGGRIVLGTRNASASPWATGPEAVGGGSCVVLSVSDNGEGMSPQTRAQIFEPFFTTKPEGKGTGLGLAMVYGIVRQSDGHIEVESEPGQGTTFALYFPATDNAVAEPDPVARRGDVQRLPARVLVVEDQPEVRQLAVTALRRAGYDVAEATDGDEALARFAPRARDFALLLTDVVMPGLNGKELATQLRGANPALLVVFMSGYEHQILEQEELAGPGAAFLAKPFTPAALVRQIDELLSSRRPAPHAIK